MRIFDNGIYRDMTPEEIEQLKQSMSAEVKETVEERLEKLEKLFTKIADFVNLQ